MKNINFENNDLKKEFKNLIKEESFLSLILDDLEKKYQNIIIKNIINLQDEIKICLNCDDTEITINIDLKKNQTMLISSYLSYATIYPNYFKKAYFPIGKLYTNNTRSLLNKNMVKANGIYDKINVFELIINDIKYGITITEYTRKLNSILLINALLSDEYEINSIVDILKVIGNVININDYEIKITNLLDNISSLIIDKGELTKYVEYNENDNYKEKIYLENDNFYIEKTTKEKIDDREVLVKKMGVRK